MGDAVPVGGGAGGVWKPWHLLIIHPLFSILCSLWGLSSTTRDRTQAPRQWECRVLTTGPPGNPSSLSLGGRFSWESRTCQTLIRAWSCHRSVSREPDLCSLPLLNFSPLYSQPLGLAAFRDMGASLCFFRQLATPVDLSGPALGFWGSSGNLGLPFRRLLLSNYLGAVALGLGELKSSDSLWVWSLAFVCFCSSQESLLFFFPCLIGWCWKICPSLFPKLNPRGHDCFQWLKLLLCLYP